MNDIESRLAEMMKAGVDDPPHRVTVQAVRRQSARRRAAARGVVTTVAAVAVVGVGLGFRLGGSPHPAVGSALYGGVPRYYVAETYSRGRLIADVRDTATGAVTATVRCPWPKTPPLIYPIATDAHQRFFMVCTAATRQHQPPPEARIYQFRVTASGQVRDDALIPGGQLGAVHVGSMVASPDGSELAVVVSPPAAGPATTTQARIVVIDTRTGARTIWRNAPASQHTIRFRIIDVSFAADGRELVFLGTRTCGAGDNPAPCLPRDQQLRALRPPAHGGLLSAGRILLRRVEPNPAAQISDAAVSADGSTLTMVTVSVPPKPQPSRVTVSQVQVGTRRQHVIYHVDGTSGLSPEVFFSTDWSGRRFLIDAGPAGHPASGWIRNGKLIPLRPFNSWISYESW